MRRWGVWGAAPPIRGEEVGMTLDRYVRGVLTVIAIALVAIALNPWLALLREPRAPPREAAPVDMELLPLELHVPVDPVEGEQREHRRMSAPHPAHRRRELAPEAARDRATVPLVEVAEEHARPDEPCGVADEPAEQLELCAPLGECQPQVAVEDMERRPLDVEVHPQGPAGLARAPRQVAALRAEDGHAREHGVAVGPRAVRARHAHDERHAELQREVRPLVAGFPARLADHFLEPDHVGRRLCDHVGDPVEVQAAVEADAPVDVVAHDREGDHAASRACRKCAYSSTGWAIADGSVMVGGWMTNVCSSSYDVPAWAPTSSTNDTSASGASIP